MTALLRRKPVVNLSERSIQDILYIWLLGKGHTHIVPNCGAFGWEADMISFTKNETGTEYEIKISVADFRADNKKPKHKDLKSGRRIYGFCVPHKFFYVVPEGLVCIKDVPSYAGLIWITSRKEIKVLKNAPKLHSLPIKKKVFSYINRGLMLRYWSLRKTRQG